MCLVLFQMPLFRDRAHSAFDTSEAMPNDWKKRERLKVMFSPEVAGWLSPCV